MGQAHKLFLLALYNAKTSALGLEDRISNSASNTSSSEGVGKLDAIANLVSQIDDALNISWNAYVDEGAIPARNRIFLDEPSHGEISRVGSTGTELDNFKQIVEHVQSGLACADTAESKEHDAILKSTESLDGMLRDVYDSWYKADNNGQAYGQMRKGLKPAAVENRRQKERLTEMKG